jgi:hypothetical protein
MPMMLRIDHRKQDSFPCPAAFSTDRLCTFFCITRLAQTETLPGVLCRNNKVTEEDLKLRCLADNLAEAQEALRVRDSVVSCSQW